MLLLETEYLAYYFTYCRCTNILSHLTLLHLRLNSAWPLITVGSSMTEFNHAISIKVSKCNYSTRTQNAVWQHAQVAHVTFFSKVDQVFIRVVFIKNSVHYPSKIL